MPSVKLTAYNMGPNATESDFDTWTAYVAKHIDEACGFKVDVDSFDFTGRNAGGPDDLIGDATDEQREIISEALQELWENGCVDNFGNQRT